MKISRVLSMMLLAVSGLALLSPAQAGSERLVMVMSVQKMAQHQLVHVRFKDKQGQSLHADVMKRLVVRRGDCGSGRELRMPEDYKFGFSPKKEMGIYLTPQIWKDAPLCFSDPEFGNLQTTIFAEEAGQSILREFN